MNKFTHLLVKSQYSLLESCITIPALVERAKSLNMEFVALADTSVLAKIPEFVRTCREADIKPLLGCEFSVFHYQHKNYTVNETNPEGADQVILFATSMEGYKNLIQLSTLANINRKRNLKAHIFLQDLVKYSEDIYALLITHSGTLGTFLDQNKFSETRTKVAKYIPIFSDKLALTHCDLLDPKDLKRLPHIISLGNELKIPIVAVNSVQAIHAQEAHEISLYNKYKQDNKPKLRQKSCWDERYFKTYKEMKELFNPIPEALENTEKIAHRIYFPFTLSDREYVTPIPEQFRYGISAYKWLQKIVLEKLSVMNIHENHEYEERVSYELSLIRKLTWERYILLISGIINFLTSQDIYMSPGFSDATGSMVLYVLGITKVDPIKFKLRPEVLMNPKYPVCIPEIILDAEKLSYKKVGTYLLKQFGDQYITKICNGFKLFSISQKERISIGESPDLRTCTYGISDEKIEKIVPLYRRDPGSLSIAQTTGGRSSYCGITPISILESNNLTLLSKVQKLIHKQNPDFCFGTLPLNDSTILEKLWEKRPNIAGSYIPKTFQEHIALIGLQLLLASSHNDQIANNFRNHILDKNGSEKPEITFIQEVLDDSFGMLLYSEQLIDCLHKLLDCSYVQADFYRRELARKSGKIEDVLKKKLHNLKKISESDCNTIIDIIHSRSKYLWKKSFIIANEITHYQITYAKIYFPEEFERPYLRGSTS